MKKSRFTEGQIIRVLKEHQAELDATVVRRGRPLMIISDNGTELTLRPGSPPRTASSRA